MIVSLLDRRVIPVPSALPPLSTFRAYLEALPLSLVIGTTCSETVNPFAVWLTGTGEALVTVDYVDVYIDAMRYATPVYMCAVLSRLEGLRQQAQMVTVEQALAVVKKVERILEGYDARRRDP